jgi:hypothetical protein
MLTNLLWLVFGCRFKLDNLVPLPSLIPGLLARPSIPLFSAGSQEWPPSPNFPQLDIVGPSSGFNKGLRSASNNIYFFMVIMIKIGIGKYLAML